MFDYGTAFKNLTAYAKRTDDGISRFYYYLLDNISDVEYNSGESWSLTLKIHKFIRTKEQGTLFQASDFLETGSDLRNFNYHIWVPLHFPDTSSGDVNFYLKYAGEQHYHLVESSFDGTELDITFVGETDQTVTHELYIDQLGTPKSVENVDSWSYNATTKILAFIVTYTSAKTVTVSWDEAGGQVAVYTLSVWGRKNGLSKNAIVNLNGENCSIISMTMYMLPYRSYLMTVRAEGDDNKRWIIVYKIT